MYLKATGSYSEVVQHSVDNPPTVFGRFHHMTLIAAKSTKRAAVGDVNVHPRQDSNISAN